MLSKRNTLLAALLPMAFLANGQVVRLNGFSGFTFRDRFNMAGSYLSYSYTEGIVEESAHFGGSLELQVRDNQSVEILYQNQPTVGYIRGSNGWDSERYSITVNYVLVGGLGYIPLSKLASAYGGVNIGAAFLSGEAGTTKLAWGGKLGLMINATPSVGLKLGAQLLSPVQSVGGGFYFGSGGSGASVSTYSSIYQFGFTGGLVFTLNGKSDGPARPAPAAGK